MILPRGPPCLFLISRRTIAPASFNLLMIGDFNIVDADKTPQKQRGFLLFFRKILCETVGVKIEEKNPFKHYFSKVSKFMAVDPDYSVFKFCFGNS